ncbi:DUF4249 domain-containing protein [Bacteroidales bacterium OttesenSCG-928-C03]|nr:DUF4249 domain-containing protein [Bacteroidales bacterium OttesenSCG-928-E04]MDL2308766.1 DUF4249 domain-containing protein [Bacteroidales bacterium OttesenSCG-928-C03]MDL2326100.1 DUF4249 domain-containing protein [Bacteroidales bacterium OttesenSCG-928-A14]
MKKIKYILLLISVVFISCQTEIDITLPDYHDKLVVEGCIETGQPAMVILSKSMPYFSEYSLGVSDEDLQYYIQMLLTNPDTLPELLGDKFITNAKVTVTSDKGESEELKFRFSLDAPLFFAYMGEQVIGEENTKYTLKIDWDNKEYEAVTTIPHTFRPDSMWFHEINDSVATLRIILNDNAATADNYQFKVKVRSEKLNDRIWAYSAPVVFDDKTFNGLTFNFELLRAVVSQLFAGGLSDEERSEYYRPYYRLNDKVIVSSTLMDRNAYRFWSTIGSEIMFGQNPFMSPPPIENNITCNTGEKALGAWCGFASTVDTLTFRK